MRSLLITAHLSSGFSAADRWSPSIDGILAYHQLMLELGIDKFNLSLSLNEQTSIGSLPLKKVEFNDNWWWACSSPKFSSQNEIIRSFYKKFNIDHSMLIKQKSKLIELTKGQFKNYSLNFKEIITKKVEWNVIGDKDEIVFILSHCKQIGSNRGKGMGLVERWTVDENEDEHTAKFSCPIPVDAAEHYNVSGIKMWRGFKPSVRLPENQCLCIMPI